MAWSIRSPALIIPLLLLGAAVVPTGGATTDSASPSDIVVAVLDTGVNPNHKEFGGYSTADPGVFVAWWDFTATHKGVAARDPFQNVVNGEVPLWDPFVAHPYDDNGHGTATASLAGGLNLQDCNTNTPKLSYAPGVKLAILKVLDASGSGDLTTIATAVRYASEVVKADVISISIGTTAPVPGGISRFDEALKGARAAGSLPVVAAGNGLGNFGLLPAPSELFYPGLSTASLIVGGGNQRGTNLATTTSSSDPEVAAWSDSVCVAQHTNTGGYKTGSGTSYATPLVAGMAANCISEAKANGVPSDPDTVETVLKHSARDTVLPYAREGWGFLGTPEFTTAKGACATGTVPAYVPHGTSVNGNALYETTVADPLRATWEGAGDVEWDPIGQRILLGVSPGSGPGVLNPSLPAGVFEVERFTVTLAVGQTLTVSGAYGPLPAPGTKDVQDVDLYLYKPGAWSDGYLLPSEIVAASGHSAGVGEGLTHVATAAGPYEVVVLGWSLVAPQGFPLTANVALAFAGEAYATGQTVLSTYPLA